MRRLMTALVLGAIALTATAVAQEKLQPSNNAQIDYRGFRNLTGEVEAPREQRLVSLADFQRMAREPNTIVLDARSADAYARGHINGAVNLPFTDFTDQSLAQTLRDPNVRILIYCNNNFSNNAEPVILKRMELALNIQTFINLHGYGYRNVYELADVVDFNDPAVRWVTS
ncbi:MAG TPA: rhodanese-like domain-containing protein [Verrucomicrobiae bacterium]|nr:rhodanese-like domain-containing protein [Verrucomicrobiae bacterium]